MVELPIVDLSTSDNERRRKSDVDIMLAIERMFEARFTNFNGDSLAETIEGTEADYWRAEELLSHARLVIKWNGQP